MVAQYGQGPQRPKWLGRLGRRSQMFDRAPSTPGVNTGPVGRPPEPAPLTGLSSAAGSVMTRPKPPMPDGGPQFFGGGPVRDFSPKFGIAPPTLPMGPEGGGGVGPSISGVAPSLGRPPMPVGAMSRIRAGLAARFGGADVNPSVSPGPIPGSAVDQGPANDVAGTPNDVGPAGTGVASAIGGIFRPPQQELDPYAREAALAPRY